MFSEISVAFLRVFYNFNNFCNLKNFLDSFLTKTVRNMSNCELQAQPNPTKCLSKAFSDNYQDYSSMNGIFMSPFRYFALIQFFKYEFQNF